jgi:hypothetical protein
MRRQDLPDEWRGLAARTELYPERNAWYLYEIALLTGGGDTPRLHCGITVHAVVLVGQTAQDNGIEIIAVRGDTPDEAIETLYQRVYEWLLKSQAATCASSPRAMCM